MSGLEAFVSGLVEAGAFVLFLALALVIGNAASVLRWLRSRWDAFMDLPSTTSVPRMLDEVERGRQ